jgi:hypothetical protein
MEHIKKESQTVKIKRRECLNMDKMFKNTYQQRKMLIKKA